MFFLAMCLSMLAMCVVRANGKLLRLEKQAGVDEPEVPRDKLLKTRFRFPTPSKEQVAGAFEVGHALSEALYKGDGYWDCTGEYKNTLRHTSNRILGYIPAYKVLGNEIYRQRAIEGLDFLLREQKEEGDFPWYYNSYHGVCNRNDGLFEAGIAGRAFVEGYKLTGERKYLDASNRVARWEMDCPVSINNNYNMFAVWHLAAHYEITGDKQVLESAIYKTREGGIPRQMPSGGWPEHNSWMWYHGIIVRGMAELLRVLPEEHPFKPELNASLIAAVNRVIREQQASGETPPNPKVKRRGHTCSFVLVGMLTARESLGDGMDKCIQGLERFRLSKLLSPAEVEKFISVWRAYDQDRATCRAAATGNLMWQADFNRFFKDVEWGEVLPDAFNCWYPCNEFDSKHVQWCKTVSERTGKPAPQMVSTGAPMFGGMGWSIPKGTLTPGRRYVFKASVKCEGGPDRVPLVLASAYAGKKRANWNPFNECVFTRENPTFDSFSEIEVPFVASNSANYVYVWAQPNMEAKGDMMSLTVDEARVVDGGPAYPVWDPGIEAFEAELDMILQPTGYYLEKMF